MKIFYFDRKDIIIFLYVSFFIRKKEVKSKGKKAILHAPGRVENIQLIK